VLTPISDSYIYSLDPTGNYGKAPILYTGSQSIGAYGRAFFRFDLSAIPASATIQSASFEAYLTQSSSILPNLEIEVRRIDAAWAETTLTWATQPKTSTIGKVNSVGIAPGYYEWDVTSLAQEWHSGAANNGLALLSYTENAVSWRGFASLESPNPARVEITYRP
jgi:hypothetical protein